MMKVKIKRRGLTKKIKEESKLLQVDIDIHLTAPFESLENLHRFVLKIKPIGNTRN